MEGTAIGHGDARVSPEARLARAAVSGDGSGFGELYRRYEQCVYNLAYRIVGSEADAVDAVQEAFPIAMRKLRQVPDRDAPFGPELLAATHDVCHDLVGGRQSDQPSEGGPEGREEEVRAASLRLPERQREALALRGLGQLSYGEIAATMELSDHSVAQLISRARINLYDELRGTVLASVAPPTPECERAMPLIAARDDGQLEASSDDAAWLDGHLAECDRCRLAAEQMQEARDSYAGWGPIAAVPWLLGETMAKVAELVGADWSEEIAEASRQAQDESQSPTVAPPAPPASPGSSRARRPAAVIAVMAALFLLVGFATAALVGDSGSQAPAEPAAGAASKSDLVSEAGPKSHKGRGGRGDAARRKQRRTGVDASTSSAQTVGGETQTPGFVPAQVTTGGGASSKPASGQNHASGKAGVQPTQQAAASKPSSKPKPAPTSTTASQPATEAPPPPTTTPSAESSPPAEEASEAPGRSGEAPGKPAGRPPH